MGQHRCPPGSSPGDICLEAGVTLFDTADVYSDGKSEEVLGEAIKGRREQVMLSTKASLPVVEGPNDADSSRSRLINACEAALRRLGTDYIDLFQLHAFDAGTPIEEVLSTLNDLVRTGKVRYVGLQLLWDLMSLGLDQGVGALVWSPLGWGRLTGKVRRDQQLPVQSRLHETADLGPPVEDEHLFRVVDTLDEIAEETGKAILKSRSTGYFSGRQCHP